MDNPFERLSNLRDYASRPFMLNDNDDYAIFNQYTNEFDIIMKYGDLLPAKERLPTPIPHKFKSMLALLMKTSTQFVIHQNYIAFYSRSRIWTYQYMEYCKSARTYIPTTPSLTSINPVLQAYRDRFDDGLMKVKLTRNSLAIIQQNRVLLYEFDEDSSGYNITLDVMKYIQVPSDYEVIDALVNRRYGVVLIRNILTQMTYINASTKHSKAHDKWYVCSPDYLQIRLDVVLSTKPSVEIPTIC